VNDNGVGTCLCVYAEMQEQWMIKGGDTCVSLRAGFRSRVQFQLNARNV